MKSLSHLGLFVTPSTVAHRLLRPWDFPSKNTGVGCRFLLQEIFPTQRSNPGLPHCGQTLYHLSHQGSLSRMWEVDHKEGWAPKNWCFWCVVLEKTLQSPLDCKEIKPVNPKGNQSWISIGRTDAETEVPIIWPSDAKSWLTAKKPDAGKIEGKRRRRQQSRRWLGSIIDSMDMSLSKLRERGKDREA